MLRILHVTLTVTDWRKACCPLTSRRMNSVVRDEADVEQAHDLINLQDAQRSALVIVI